jgi:conjugative relaxase-like TrwC/TraI family protein
MLNISNPLSSGQAQAYHKLEFTSEAANYYKQGDAVQGQWQGRLAETMGLSGAVSAEEFARLTEGRHPQTDEQMVRHREASEYKNSDGSTTKAVEHRAGWDATFSAPKSVSLTALVGGDERVREAHREAVTAALTELERYTQARIGSNHAAETTGKFIAAKFEHDTARPVDGYAAPQLHTHAVIFNVTERADGSTRALQPQSYFDSQNFATAVYQSHLTYKLRNLGYDLERGKSGAPEIKGYSQAYLDASSLRSQQIKEHLEKTGHSGAEAAQIRIVRLKTNCGQAKSMIACTNGSFVALSKFLKAGGNTRSAILRCLLSCSGWSAPGGIA